MMSKKKIPAYTRNYRKVISEIKRQFFSDLARIMTV